MNNSEFPAIAHAACVINKVTICTVAYDDGWWVFTVPGEGSRRVIDSRQARSEVGMLMNPWVEVDPEDVDDWAEFGPCAIRHTPIPERTQEKEADGEEGGDTSGDDEFAGYQELDDSEADKEPGLSRANQWQSSLDRDFWMQVTGVQSRNTGTIGDERMVREIDRQKKSLKAGIDLLLCKRNVPAKKLAKLKNMLEALQKYRDEYVRAATGKDATGRKFPPHYRLFYPEGTEKLVKRVRAMLLRAIRSSVARDSKASVSLIHAINRGTHLGYTPDPHCEWRVMPFERKRLPRMVGQADKGMAAA